MMHSGVYKSRRLLIGMSIFFLLAAGGARAGHHEAPSPEAKAEKWDRAVVAKLAGELEAVLEYGAEVSAKRAQDRTVLEQRKYDAAQGELRRARESAQDYVRALEGDVTQGESARRFVTVRDHVRSAIKTADNAEPSPEMRRILDRLRKIGTELERLHGLP